MTDNINPSHYRHFRQEVVDTLEDWVGRAPDPVSGAHQYNAGRYLSRMWDKPAEGGPVEHVDKAIWYLERLKGHLKKQEASKPCDYQAILDAAANDRLADLLFGEAVAQGPDCSFVQDLG